MVRLLELVVGGPGYDWRLDLGYGVFVKDGAQGAWGEDVAFDGVNLFRRDYGSPECNRLSDPGLVDVSGDDPGAIFPQVLGVVVCDLPETLDCDGLPVAGSRSPLAPSCTPEPPGICRNR